MKNLLKKLTVPFVVFFTVLFGSCVVIDQGQDDPELFMKGAVAQIVYSTTKKDPESYKKIWTTTVNVLKAIDLTVGKTPQEIAELVKVTIDDKTGDYSLVIDGAVDAVFTRFNFKWNNNIDPEKLSKIVNWAIDAIQTGLDKYDEAVDSALAGIPDELDTAGLFKK